MPKYNVEVVYSARMIVQCEVKAPSKRVAEQRARRLDSAYVEVWQTEPEWMGPNRVRRGSTEEIGA